MEDLLQQMRRRKSVQACIDLALADVYGEDEEAVGWSTCIETTFGRFKRVRLGARMLCSPASTGETTTSSPHADREHAKRGLASIP